MKWNSWGAYALAAVAVTLLVAFVSPLPGERALADAFRSLHPAGGLWDGLNGVVKDQTLFGAVVLVVTLGVYFLFPPREVAVPLAALMGTQAIEWVLGPIVERTRPGMAGLLGHSGFSFPSGQALFYAAFLGALAVVVARRVRSSFFRRALVASLLTLAVLGGIARLASGADWFSDVLGAWLWATAWVFWLKDATRQVG